MKESHLFLIAAIIFMLLAIILFNCSGVFPSQLGMLLGLCSLFLLCGGADANNNSSNIIDEFEIEKSCKYRVYYVKCKGDDWKKNDYFPTYQEAESFCKKKDFFHWRIEPETL